MFIDECGTSTKMARMYGRAARGERCRAPVPHGHWKTTTFVGALRLSGMTAPMTLDGAMNGAAFLAYVDRTAIIVCRPRGLSTLLWNPIGGAEFRDAGIDQPTGRCARPPFPRTSSTTANTSRIWKGLKSVRAAP